MLFPAFAKIPNSPYLIKRLLARAPLADLLARCLYEYLFHFLVSALTSKVIGILCF